MLSVKAKKVLTVAVANKAVGAELAAAIDAGGNVQAAAIAAIPASTNLTAAVVAAATFAPIVGTYVNAAEPTGAEVDATADAALAAVKAIVDVKADNVDLETLRTEVESRMDAVEAKINAVIAALKASGLMAP